MSHNLHEDEAQAICLRCGWTKTVRLTGWLPDASPSLAASEALLEHRRAAHKQSHPTFGAGFVKRD